MIESRTIGQALTATSVAVEVRDVTKKFGANLAANKINLSISEGEFFSFLGPSGCGKTTLLRMIAGFETPSEGAILLSGVNMQGVPPHKRQVNTVFQNYALFPHLTLSENVAFGLKSSRNCSQSEIAERVKSALDLVRLTTMSDRYPHQISGGQQQRAALARAVVNKPSVLLLDEPLSALDPQIREEMQIELAALQKKLGITFIMVTHDQNEALALSDRVAVFNKGNLEQVATPEVIYKHPQTLFVAKFIGQTNVIEGEIIGEHRDLYQVRVADGLIFLAQKKTHSLQTGTAVALLVKPHTIRISDKSSTASETELLGTIINRSFQGTSTEYVVALGDNLRLRISSLNVSLDTPSRFFVDDEVSVLVPPEACEILPI